MRSTWRPSIGPFSVRGLSGSRVSSAELLLHSVSGLCGFPFSLSVTTASARSVGKVLTGIACDVRCHHAAPRARPVPAPGSWARRGPAPAETLAREKVLRAARRVCAGTCLAAHRQRLTFESAGGGQVLDVESGVVKSSRLSQRVVKGSMDAQVGGVCECVGA